MQDLLTINDPDWAAFNSGDPEFLLRATGSAIRKYCGWHIAPNIQFTLDKLPIGTDGRIMLPSLMVTDVSSLAIQYSPAQEFQLQDPSSYQWFEPGYILPVGQAFWGSQWYAGYYYEPGPFFLPVTNAGLASVTFNSGYTAVPDDIKQIAFELARWTQQLNVGGDIKAVASPGFRLQLGGNGGTGMTLNPDQKCRLASYRIGAVK